VQQRKLHVPGSIGCNVIKQMCDSKCNKLNPALFQALKRYEVQLVVAERIFAKITGNETCYFGNTLILANTDTSINGGIN